MKDDILPWVVGLGIPVVSLAAGFVGAWIGGMREHKRWLLQQRLTEYAEFIACVRIAQNRLTALPINPDLPGFTTDDLQRRADDWALARDAMFVAVARVRLLGPREVSHLAHGLAISVMDHEKLMESGMRDTESRQIQTATQVLFLEAAHKALNIKDPPSEAHSLRDSIIPIS